MTDLFIRPQLLLVVRWRVKTFVSVARADSHIRNVVASDGCYQTTTIRMVIVLLLLLREVQRT